jgi:hypothetical protein
MADHPCGTIDTHCSLIARRWAEHYCGNASTIYCALAVAGVEESRSRGVEESRSREDPKYFLDADDFLEAQKESSVTQAIKVPSWRRRSPGKAGKGFHDKAL